MRSFLLLLISILCVGSVFAADPVVPLQPFPYDVNWRTVSPIYGWNSTTNAWVPLVLSPSGVLMVVSSGVFKVDGSTVSITNNHFDVGGSTVVFQVPEVSTGTIIQLSSYTVTTIAARADRKVLIVHNLPTNSDAIRYRLGVNADILTAGDYLDIGEKDTYIFKGAVYLEAVTGVPEIFVGETW